MPRRAWETSRDSTERFFAEQVAKQPRLKKERANEDVIEGELNRTPSEPMEAKNSSS